MASADPAGHFFAIFGAIFAAIGIFFLLLGVGLIVARGRMRRRGVSTTGTIVGYDWGRSRATSVDQTTSRSLFPIVEFDTADGRQVHARARNGSNPRPGRQGGPITVLYDPDRPERFWAQTPGGRRMASVGAGLCVAVGLVLGLIGLAVLASSL